MFTDPDFQIDDEEFEQRLKQFDADMKLVRADQASDAKTQNERFAIFLQAQRKTRPKNKF